MLLFTNLVVSTIYKYSVNWLISTMNLQVEIVPNALNPKP